MSAVLRCITPLLVEFHCPGCGMRHQLPVNDGPPPVWEWNGSVDRPTFVPPILVRGVQDSTFRIRSGGEREGGNFVCHSWVRDGQIQYLGDCTHGHAGKTVALPVLA